MDGIVPFPPEYVERYRAKGYWEDRTLRDVFAQACTEYADRVALHHDGADMTYGELEERAARAARGLWALGLRPLDRVVLQLPNTADFAVTHLGLQKIGVIPIMALPAHRYRELEQFARLSDAVAAITPDRSKDADHREIVARVRATAPSLRLHIVSGDPGQDATALSAVLAGGAGAEGDVDLAAVEVDPMEAALFQLSGGTTGVPKLIPRLHNDYVFNTKNAMSVCDIRPDDCLLNVLPISHNLPLACPGLHGFLLAGARTVLHPTTRGAQVFPLIEKHRVTHIHVVPALLIKWLNDPLIHEYDLSSVRVIQSGGQRLQPETRALAQRMLPGCRIQENFGMAEGLLTFVRLDDPEEVRMETVGRPVCPDDEVLLLDENGQEVPDGEVGELAARGPYTLRGYFRAPEHNARAFTPDGFYLSGDLMRRHPSGNYVVAGRRKDLINRGGEKISAEEIENLLIGHPAIVNVACIPVNDPVLGERMCACVVPREGVAPPTLHQLTEFLSRHEIAKFKLPERLEIMPSLPLSHVGKVSKKDLVARFADDAPSAVDAPSADDAPSATPGGDA
nr:AMP-binding protein [Streptomyces sp. BA2]